jgi:hypothetical protein
MHEVEEIFKYYTEVSAVFPMRVARVIDPSSLSLPKEDDWKPYRSQEEFDHMALPRFRSRMGSLPMQAVSRLAREQLVAETSD